MTKVTGSVQVRSNHLYLMIRYTDANGNKVQKAKATGIPVGTTAKEQKANRRKADLELAEWIHTVEQEKTIDSDRRLLQAISEWLETKKPEIRENSYLAYVSYVENHLKPYFKTRNKLLKDYTVRDMQRYVDYEAKNVTSQSIKKYLVVLHGVFDDACRYGEVEMNPCDKVKLPKPTEFRGQAFTPEQASILIHGLDGCPVEAAVMLGIYLGLRRSEIAGLRWQDIDLDAGTVHICNTVVRFSKLIEDEHTKSAASDRTLPMPEDLTRFLHKLQEKQSQDRLLCGSEYKNSGHVCAWPDGRPQSPDYIYEQYKKLLKKLDLPNIRLHDLRHTTGSLLINGGISAKQVQEFLGHEDVTTTLNTYTHVDWASKKSTAEALKGILSPG